MIIRRPARFLDWVILVGLAVACLVTLRTGGGNPFTDSGLMWVGLLLVGLTLLHVVWRFLVGEQLQLSPALLVPLPLLVWMSFSAWWISPAPWYAQGQLALAWQAYLVLWLAVHHARARPRLLALLVIVLAVGGYGLVIFGQDILNRAALPSLSFTPSLLLIGPWQHEVPLAVVWGLAVVVWPLAVLGTVQRRFPAPMRLVLGLMAFLILLMVALVGGPGLYTALLVQVVLLVLMAGPDLRSRGILLGSLSGAIFLAWLFTMGPGAALQERYASEIIDVELEAASAYEAVVRFAMDDPALGHGLGSFPLLSDQYLSDFGGQGRYVFGHSSHLQILGELGLPGLVLALGLIGFLVWKGLRLWYRQPYESIPAADLYRAQTAGVDLRASGRSRRRSRRRYPVPLGKLLLGGTLVGLLGLLVLGANSPVWLFGGVLLPVAALVGLGVRLIWEKGWPVPNRPLLRVGLTLAPVLAAFLMVRLVPVFPAHAAYVTGYLDLKAAEAERAQLFDDPRRLNEAQYALEGAIGIHSGHGDAWGTLGLARWLEREVAIRPTAELADDALQALERAREQGARRWEYAVVMAEVQAYRGEPAAVIEALFEEAVALSPLQPEARVAYAAWLWSEGRTPEARQQIEEALLLNPQHPAALEYQRRLSL